MTSNTSILAPPPSRVHSDIWDSAVETSELGCFTHLSGWMELCRRSLGLHPYPLARHGDSTLVSVFPLAYDTSERELRSPPGSGMGGPTRAEDLPFYLGEVNRLARSLRARTIRLCVPTTETALHCLASHGYHTGSGMPHYVLNLSGSPSFEDIVAERYDTKARRGLRRSREHDVKVFRVQPSDETLRRTFDLYRRTLSFKSVPAVLPESFFLNIAETLRNYVVCFEAVHKGEVIGSSVCFAVNGTLSAWYILGRVEMRKLFVNHALYSAVIHHAVSEGLDLVDFGPSALTSRAHEIKVSHGGRPRSTTTAVWMRNPASRTLYAAKQHIWKWSLSHPQSRLSALCRRTVLRRK